MSDELDERWYRIGQRLMADSWWFSEDVPTMLLLQDLASGTMSIEDVRKQWRERRKASAVQPDESDDYNPVPLKPAGSVMVKYVDGGKLKPGIVREDE